LLATGFVADMELFRGIGVELRGPELAPVFDEETMETNVSRVFVAGTAAGGTQVNFAHFISTSHDHVAKIVQAISGQAATRLGTIPSRNNAVTLKEVKAN
jgi:thioredoxin reductase (NADPH)